MGLKINLFSDYRLDCWKVKMSGRGQSTGRQGQGRRWDSSREAYAVDLGEPVRYRSSSRGGRDASVVSRDNYSDCDFELDVSNSFDHLQVEDEVEVRPRRIVTRTTQRVTLEFPASAPASHPLNTGFIDPPGQSSPTGRSAPASHPLNTGFIDQPGQGSPNRQQRGQRSPQGAGAMNTGFLATSPPPSFQTSAPASHPLNTGFIDPPSQGSPTRQRQGQRSPQGAGAMNTAPASHPLNTAFLDSPTSVTLSEEEWMTVPPARNRRGRGGRSAQRYGSY